MLAALVLSTALLGQQDSSYLQEVVITANKYEKKQAETGKIITVISREQLRQSGGRSVGELLNQVAGVTVPGANNNLGSNQTLSIRGSAAGNVLILLDGIPVNDPSVISNYFDLNLLSLDQVERIEILKGGQSTLYGSDAVAGVVNIISRKSTKGKPALNASVAGGNFGTLKSALGISGLHKKIDYLVQLSSLNAKGFSAATDSTGTKNFDRDDYRQQTARIQTGYRIGNYSSLRANLLYSQYHTSLDAAAFTDEKDFTARNSNQLAGLGWSRKKATGQIQFNYQYNRVVRDYLDDSSFRSSPFVSFVKSNYEGITHFAELFTNRNLGNWELLGGIDFRKHQTTQSYWSTGPWGPYAPPMLKAEMDQWSPYGSVVYKKSNWTIEAGTRINRHSTYGTNATYTLNPSYRLNEKSRLFVNLYSAYKIPTLYQLFDPAAGNKELRPEQGQIQEFGLEWIRSATFQGRIVGFNRRSTSTILYNYNPSSWSGQYINAALQRNYGVEVESRLQFGATSFQLNYTYTDGAVKGRYDGTGVDLGKDTSYFNLYRIPRHAVNIMTRTTLGSWLFNFSGRLASSRQEFIYGDRPVTLDGYLTLDFYTEYRFVRKKGLRAFLDLRNLTNTRYEELRGYNARRFTLMTGLLLDR